MLKFIDYEDKKYLLVSSFFISLACMTHYVGIFALISFLSLLILKAKEDIVKKGTKYIHSCLSLLSHFTYGE